MIDLQMHSNFSDGSMSPTQLVEEAKAIGLTAIALTDHDTINGVPEFLQAGQTYKMTTVSGVELSVDTRLPYHGHMHILGLFIDPRNQELKRTLDFLRNKRKERAEKILQKLNELGVPVTKEELLEEAGEGSIGRPHLAKIMVRKKFVPSISEAFEKYLKKGGPAYVDKVKLGEADAIRLIKQAGGLAILAHPHLMKYDTFEETREKILQLKALGLDGLEVYYSGMPAAFSQKLIKLAEEEHFAISGGSDYHGANKDGIQMGRGKGDLAIPHIVYENLKIFWEMNSKTNHSNL
ncbi:MAG: PHP domain-containing protein [Calditrichia bacterium]